MVNFNDNIIINVFLCNGSVCELSSSISVKLIQMFHVKHSQKSEV